MGYGEVGGLLSSTSPHEASPDHAIDTTVPPVRRASGLVIGQSRRGKTLRAASSKVSIFVNASVIGGSLVDANNHAELKTVLPVVATCRIADIDRIVSRVGVAVGVSGPWPDSCSTPGVRGRKKGAPALVSQCRSVGQHPVEVGQAVSSTTGAVGALSFMHSIPDIADAFELYDSDDAITSPFPATKLNRNPPAAFLVPCGPRLRSTEPTDAATSRPDLAAGTQLGTGEQKPSGYFFLRLPSYT